MYDAKITSNEKISLAIFLIFNTSENENMAYVYKKIYEILPKYSKLPNGNFQKKPQIYGPKCGNLQRARHLNYQNFFLEINLKL